MADKVYSGYPFPRLIPPKEKSDEEEKLINDLLNDKNEFVRCIARILFKSYREGI